jgi:hypothetical protein
MVNPIDDEQPDIPGMTSTGGTFGIANCGSLGVSLQLALEVIRRHDNNSDTLPAAAAFMSDDQADRILEALGTAVAATTTTTTTTTATATATSTNDAADPADSPDVVVVTAAVDYYNRLGDKWRIVAAPESAELLLVPHDDDDATTTAAIARSVVEGGRRRKRKRQQNQRTVRIPLPRLEVLAYKDDAGYHNI